MTDQGEARPYTPRASYVATLLLISSTVTWRQGFYYSGGVDPTVAAKAVLGLLAAYLATQQAAHVPERQRLNGRPILYLMVYVTVTLLGAFATGTTFTASAVLVVRLLLITYTVYQLAVALPLEKLAVALAGSMSAFAVVASVTGTTAGSQRVGAGRLIGGIPALQPNEIAQLCGISAIVLLWRGLQGHGRSWDVGAILVLLGLVWLTGSRTTLGFFIVATLVLLVQVRRFNLGFVVAVLVFVPVAAVAALATSSVSNYFGRGGTENLLTFNQRTVAWTAALHVHTGFWQVWFGNGLSRVTVPVVAQYRTDQLLDSSWLSALVQSGLAGVAVLVLLLISTLRSVARAPRERRGLATALLSFVLLLATFESGLVNATPIFVMLVLLGLTAGTARGGPATDGVVTGSGDEVGGPGSGSAWQQQVRSS